MTRISRSYLWISLACSVASLATAEPPHAESATAPAADAPRIVFEQELVDLGDTPPGKVLEVTYGFRNEGSERLNLVELQPSCGCMLSSADRFVDPGESGSIRVRIDTANMRGQVEKGLLVRTNDPDRFQTRLAVKFRIESPVHVEPAWVAHRVFKGDPPDPQIVTLSSQQQGFDVGVIETDSPFLVARVLDRTVAVDGTVRVRLEVDVDRENAPLGALGGFVTVATNHAEAPKVELRVNGLVLGPVVATPRKVYLSEVDIREAGRTSHMIYVTKRSSIDFELRSVTSSDPAVLVDPQTIEPGHVYAIRVTLDPERIELGKVSSVLTIATNDPYEPEVEVFVQGRIVTAEELAREHGEEEGSR